MRFCHNRLCCFPLNVMVHLHYMYCYAVPGVPLTHCPFVFLYPCKEISSCFSYIYSTTFGPRLTTEWHLATLINVAPSFLFFLLFCSFCFSFVCFVLFNTSFRMSVIKTVFSTFVCLCVCVNYMLSVGSPVVAYIAWPLISLVSDRNVCK